MRPRAEKWGDRAPIHPERAEAARVAGEVERPRGREHELGRHADPDDAQRPARPVEDGRQARAHAQLVRGGEGLEDHGLVRGPDTRQPTREQQHAAERRPPVRGQGDHAPDGRLGEIRQREPHQLREARVREGDAGQRLDPRAQRLRRAAQRREHVAEALLRVVRALRHPQRIERAAERDEARDPAGDDGGDGDDLPLEAPQVAEELAVEGAHHVTNGPRPRGPCVGGAPRSAPRRSRA